MAREDYVQGSTARKRARGKQSDIHPILEERRRAAKAVHYAASSVFLLLGAIAVMLGIAFYFISLQNSVTSKREHYARLQSEYASLKRSNDLYEERILSKVDMEEIARIARDELGMHLAGEGQIIMYSGAIDDYVTQYTALPAD
ncbi:MAG: septum formation initiator family protein [Lachnospiraceae bacterium]|nr:septum formation initiator family protein [Lachnospiraceae bacterium]